MRLDVSKLKTKGQIEEFNFTENWGNVEFRGDIIEFIDPVSFIGKITNIGESFEVEGQIKTTIKTSCYRCLEDAIYNVDVNFIEEYTNKNVQDDDKIIFKDDFIELNEYVLGSILLNLPMKMLCRPDCKGLCPVCGTNLNFNVCQCEVENIDPRLSILKNLL